MSPRAGQGESVSEQSGYSQAEDGSSLYMRIYRPADGPSRAAVVLVSADGEERTWAQRAWVNLARHLAAAGSPVVRFDFRGQGESDGEFEATDIASRLADLRVAVAYAQEAFGTPPVVVGLRLGANLAAMFAASDCLRPPRVVAIEPVASGRGYADEMLKRNVASQFVMHRRVLAGRDKLIEQIRSGSTVSCNGFQLAAPLIDSLATLDDAARLAGRSDVAIVGLSGNKSAETIVEGVAPFWVEAPTFRSHPLPLFEAVARIVAAEPPAAAGGAAGLNEISRSGARAIDLGQAGVPVCATWHEAVNRRAAVLFTSPGPNDRAGPHGLYVRLARRLAAAGTPVLRLDPVGAGESRGEDDAEQDRSIADVYKEINEGRHVQDAARSLAWLRERGVDRIVITGLCGGASTAMLAAARDGSPRLRLVLLGTPVLHQGVGAGQVLSDRHLEEEAALMRRKMLDPTSIIRFLTFRSDYRVLFNILRGNLARRLSRSARDARLHPQTNLSFLSAWESGAGSGLRTTFVYSGLDRLLALFRENFAPLVRGEGLPPTTDVVVLERTNHNVTDRDAENVLYEILEAAASGRDAQPDAGVGRASGVAH